MRLGTTIFLERPNPKDDAYANANQRHQRNLDRQADQIKKMTNNTSSMIVKVISRRFK
jgi:hypothetical protein